MNPNTLTGGPRTAISISAARSVDLLPKVPAMSTSATPPGRYVAEMAAFEPLSWRPARFHRPARQMHDRIIVMILYVD